MTEIKKSPTSWSDFFEQLDEFHESAEYKASVEEEAKRRAEAKAAIQYPVLMNALRELGVVLCVDQDGTVTAGRVNKSGAFVDAGSNPALMIRFELDSETFPESYDAFIDKQKIGRVRAKRGVFDVFVDEQLVFSDRTFGYAEMTHEERDVLLDKARAYLYERHVFGR